MAYGRVFAKKVDFDGYKFDSEMEYQRYLYLKDKLEKKEIANLKVHPVYLLQEGYTNFDGKKVKPLNYEADFEYINLNTGETVVEDVKGMEMEDFKIHRKIFDYQNRYTLSLKVLKWSKTTGFVPIEEYKKIMKSKRQALVEEKNYYKNIVLKQQHDKEMAERKRERELNRIKELQSLEKLTKAQQTRLNELLEKYKENDK